MKDNLFEKDGFFTLLFCVLILASGFVYFACLLATHGNLFDNYFIANDWQDTGMDYFNMLHVMDNGDPYQDNSNYPALVFCFFEIAHCLLPSGTPDVAKDLRAWLPATVPYMFLMVLCLAATAYLVRKLYGQGRRYSNLLSFALIISAPILFTLERGNTILLVLLLLLFFVSEYDSPSKLKRVLAYSALAIATGIKDYPAIFSLLVLRGHHKKDFIPVCLLIIAIYFIPFFAFGGMSSISSMLLGFSVSTDEQIIRGPGHMFSATFLVRDFAALFGIRLVEVSFLAQVVALVMCLAGFCLSRKSWQQLLMLTSACIWVPGFSATYTLILLIPTVVLFLKDANEKGIDKTEFSILVTCVLLAVALSPTIFPCVQSALQAWPEGVGKSPLYWGDILINASLVALFVLTAATAIRDRFQLSKAQE